MIDRCHSTLCTTEVRGRLIYDGDCGVCTRLSRWLERSWGNPAFEVISSQELGEHGCAQLGLTAREASAAAWWIEDGASPQRGHRAVAGALGKCAGWRCLVARLIVVPGISTLAAGVYTVFARLRHRLPGPVACRAPGVT